MGEGGLWIGWFARESVFSGEFSTISRNWILLGRVKFPGVTKSPDGIKRHVEHAGTEPRQPRPLALNRPPGSGGLRASAAEAPSPRAFLALHFPCAAPKWPRVQLARQTLPLLPSAPSGSAQCPPCRRPMSLSTRPLLTLLLGPTDTPFLGSVPGVHSYPRSPFHRMMFYLDSKQATPEASSENKCRFIYVSDQKMPPFSSSFLYLFHNIMLFLPLTPLPPSFLGGQGDFPSRLPPSHGTSARLIPPLTHSSVCVCRRKNFRRNLLCKHCFSQVS